MANGFRAAGALVVVLVWVYYSAQIFLLGAEFTWVYACTFGSRRATGPDPLGERRKKGATPRLVRHIDEAGARTAEREGRAAPV